MGCKGTKVSSLKVTDSLRDLVLKRWGTLDFRLIEYGYWETGEYPGRGNWLDETTEEGRGDKGIMSSVKRLLSLWDVWVSMYKGLRGSHFIGESETGTQGEAWGVEDIYSIHFGETGEADRGTQKDGQVESRAKWNKKYKICSSLMFFPCRFPGTLSGSRNTVVNPRFLFFFFKLIYF